MTRQVWLQIGRHHGDNAQVLALGDILQKKWSWEPLAKTPQDALLPPWPDAIIGAGFRNIAQALRIKQISRGQTKIIRIGRPRQPHQNFDLTITTPQYGPIADPRVMFLSVPLSASITPRQPNDTAREMALAAHLAVLPRPWSLLSIGGPTAVTLFNEHDLRIFMEQAQAHVAGGKGSALVITSPRTPPKLAAHLDAHLAKFAVPFGLWLWNPSDNPYRDLLNLADDVLSTGESSSMISDAVHLGKPLYLMRPRQAHAGRTLDRIWDSITRKKKRGLPCNELENLLLWGQKRGWIRPRKRLDLYADHIVEAALAGWLDGSAKPHVNLPVLQGEIDEMTSRLAHLWDDPAP